MKTLFIFLMCVSITFYTFLTVNVPSDLKKILLLFVVLEEPLKKITKDCIMTTPKLNLSADMKCSEMTY
jgi:hypothetical protein